MRLSTPRVIVSVLALAAVIAAGAMPQAFGPKVASAVSALQGADRNWLAPAMLGCGRGCMSCVCAWRVALAASGSEISLARGTASLGVGAAVNSFTPARIG